MDPFIIVKNYRQQRQALFEELPPAPPRLFLRELDPNALAARAPAPRMAKQFSEEDKENFNFMMESEAGEELMKKLPRPHQCRLINYSDYDLTY
jgi:hypothetical protein